MVFAKLRQLVQVWVGSGEVARSFMSTNFTVTNLHTNQDLLVKMSLRKKMILTAFPILKLRENLILLQLPVSHEQPPNLLLRPLAIQKHLREHKLEPYLVSYRHFNFLMGG